MGVAEAAMSFCSTSVPSACEVVVASDAVLGGSDASVLNALLSTGVVVEVSETGGVPVASDEIGADDVASS